MRNFNNRSHLIYHTGHERVVVKIQMIMAFYDVRFRAGNPLWVTDGWEMLKEAIRIKLKQKLLNTDKVLDDQPLCDEAQGSSHRSSHWTNPVEVDSRVTLTTEQLRLVPVAAFVFLSVCLWRDLPWELRSLCAAVKKNRLTKTITRLCRI